MKSIAYFLALLIGFLAPAAQLVDGHLEPTEVQPEGKAAMSYEAWRNGAQPADGESLE